MRGIFASIPDFGHRLAGMAFGAFAALALAVPAAAQDLETFDPDAAYSQQSDAVQGGIDGDLATVPEQDAEPPLGADTTAPETAGAIDDYAPAPVDNPAAASEQGGVAPVTTAAVNSGQTYGEDDLIGAAEGVFGKGAEGLAKLIEDLLEKQGEPNGYIVGREAGGAFIVGARYGSGTLYHKVEGSRQVYWTGPSIGFDVGANAANTFVLVYNLYDSEDLFNRFPAGEGQAYFVGGLNASYLRRGDVVLIPIRVGAGLRLGVNAGYMKFSKEQKWVPF